MEDNILETIKKLLGIDSSDTAFDFDIKTAINTVMFALGQEGIGPKGFVVSDDSTWSDFVPDIENLEAIKNLIHLKVRLIFDPPTSSILTDSINACIKEYEWRLYIDVGNY